MTTGVKMGKPKRVYIILYTGLMFWALTGCTNTFQEDPKERSLATQIDSAGRVRDKIRENFRL